MTFFVPALKDISERSHPWGLPLQRAEIALHKGYLFPIEREDNSLQRFGKMDSTNVKIFCVVDEPFGKK